MVTQNQAGASVKMETEMRQFLPSEARLEAASHWLDSLSDEDLRRLIVEMMPAFLKEA